MEDSPYLSSTSPSILTFFEFNLSPQPPDSKSKALWLPFESWVN